jgi:hypothetical protein
MLSNLGNHLNKDPLVGPASFERLDLLDAMVIALTDDQVRQVERARHFSVDTGDIVLRTVSELIPPIDEISTQERFKHTIVDTLTEGHEDRVTCVLSPTEPSISGSNFWLALSILEECKNRDIKRNAEMTIIEIAMNLLLERTFDANAELEVNIIEQDYTLLGAGYLLAKILTEKPDMVTETREVALEIDSGTLLLKHSTSEVSPSPELDEINVFTPSAISITLNNDRGTPQLKYEKDFYGGHNLRVLGDETEYTDVYMTERHSAGVFPRAQDARDITKLVAPNLPKEHELAVVLEILEQMEA